MQGKPVVGALVVLQPTVEATGTPRPTGRTDGEGTFALHTFTGEDGAPAGSYRIGIVAVRSGGEGARNVMEKGAALVTPASSIDPKYADPSRSGLTAEVKPGENTLPEIQLKPAAPVVSKGSGEP